MHLDQNNEPPRITFEGEEFQRSAQSFQTQTPKIVRWVVHYSGGYIKDEKQAQYALIGFVMVAIVVTIFIWSSGSSSGKQNETRAMIEKAIKATNVPQ